MADKSLTALAAMPPAAPQADAQPLACRPAQHPHELVTSLTAQAHKSIQPLGSTLLGLGWISSAELADTLKTPALGPSQALGERLLEQGRLSSEQLDLALNLQLGYARVDALRFPIEPQAWRLTPVAMLQRLNVLPLMRWEGQLIVAMADPKRQSDLDELAWASESRVRATVADAQQIRQRLQAIIEGQDAPGLQAHGTATAGAAERWLAQAEAQTAGGTTDPDQIPAHEGDNGLAQLINQMIIDARTQGASDIHIEVPAGRQEVQVRFRLDGRLQPYRELPHSLRAALVARLKIMAGLDIAERRKPQDGKIPFARYSPAHPMDLRMVSIPTVQGLEDVVLRLLSATQAMSLEQLGLHPQNLARLKAVVQRPHGLILCAGPTGSGKSTTLHAALAHLNTPERKIWTAEDPVEISQPGLRQVQINPRIDWTFEKALRSFLRADPDVIMVGEVRDRETARTALEAALTGHLVLSTIHTNSAAETVTRLLDWGIDPFHFADSLLAVLGQRLVGRLCQRCRRSTSATAAELEQRLHEHLGSGPQHRPALVDRVLADWKQRLGLEGTLLSWHAAGCSHCQGTGLRGRLGVHELLIVTPELRGLIQSQQVGPALQACAMDQGMLSLRQDGIEKVLQGLTTVDEVRAISSA